MEMEEKEEMEREMEGIFWGGEGKGVGGRRD